MTYYTFINAKDHIELRSRKADIKHSDVPIDPDAIRAIFDYIYTLERRIDKLEEDVFCLQEELDEREDNRAIPMQ